MGNLKNNRKKEKKHLSTQDAAEILGVDIGAVSDWIDQGKIKAFRTPGGHRRIKKDDFSQFMRNYNIPFPKEMRKEKQSILVVEDESLVRMDVCGVLQMEFPKFQIFEAEDGFEAGRKLELLHPNLIILDMALPGIDGIQVCKKIREGQEYSQTKILAVSAYASVYSQKAVLSAGADSFLAKPFTSNQLVYYVKELIG